MQFIDNAPLYRLIRITGPESNLLGLRLSLHPTTESPTIEVLDAPGTSGQLIGREVADQVMLGVADASAALDKRYAIACIQYVSTDSPPVTVYRALANELVRRIDASLNASR